MSKQFIDSLPSFQPEKKLLTTVLNVATEHELPAQALDLAGAANRSTIALRVGSGKATKCSTRDRVHFTVTLGQKMVAYKHFFGTKSWTTGNEIQNRGYMGGDLSLASALAHTVYHELAHATQHLLYGREYGSVHNAAFYQALDDLHASYPASTLLAAIAPAVAAYQETRPLESVADAGYIDPAEVTAGEWYLFTPKDGRERLVRVTKPNQKTVQFVDEQGRKGRCSPALLRHRESAGVLPAEAAATADEAEEAEERPWQVGDPVCFDHQGDLYRGTIKNLNKKSAEVRTTTPRAAQVFCPFPRMRRDESAEATD